MERGIGALFLCNYQHGQSELFKILNGNVGGGVFLGFLPSFLKKFIPHKFIQFFPAHTYVISTEIKSSLEGRQSSKG